MAFIYLRGSKQKTKKVRIMVERNAKLVRMAPEGYKKRCMTRIMYGKTKEGALKIRKRSSILDHKRVRREPKDRKPIAIPKE